MKNLGVFSSKTCFFLLTPLGITRQGISSCIFFLLVVINFKIIAEQLLCPSNLTKTETFYVYETTKVIVIGKNKDLIFAVFQVVLSSFENFNNGQKLCIVDFIISFSKNYFSKKIGYQVPLTKIGLGKNRIRNQQIKNQLT